MLNNKNRLINNTIESFRKIKEKSVRGGVATVSGQVLRTLINVISTVFLGRLLFPEDFGLVAMVLSITNFALMLSDLSFSSATIQKKEISHDEISTLFWINTFIGIMLTIAVIIISPFIVLLYNDKRLLNITIVLSFSFLFNGLGVQHKALLSRNLEFVLINIIEILSFLIGSAFAVVLAFFNFGYWSLVIMHLSIPIIRTVSFLSFSRWRPSLPRRKTDISELFNFGMNVTINSTFNYFSRNMDNVLIGKYLGTEQLGYYSKAYNLMMLPIRQIRTPLLRVGLPALSRLQSDHNKYSNYYLNITKIISFFAVPLAFYLGLFAEDVLLILLGPGWNDAAVIFRILSIVAAVQPVMGTTGMVLLSFGYSKRYMKMGIVISIITILSFVSGLPWGMIGVAFAYSVMNIVLIIPQLIISFRGTPIKVSMFLKEQSYIYSISILMIISVYLISRIYVDSNLILRFVISTSLAGLIYLIICQSTKKGREILSVVRKSLGVLFKSKKTMGDEKREKK